MQALSISKTFQTPEVLFDPGRNIFEIKGNSLPNNPHWFYIPVIEWLDEYAKKGNPETWIVFRIHHQNSSTKKMILEMMKILERLHRSGKKVKMDWHYLTEDDDMLQAGLEFKRVVTFPVRTLPHKESI